MWDKPGPLTVAERERLQRHPALTEVILARSTGLGPLSTLAGLHHERLDGSGYRGVTASSLPITARVLAVADAYQSKLEPRPHRAPLTPDQATVWLHDQVAAGTLDGDVTRAVLEVAGQNDLDPASTMPSILPAKLTKREVEVLRLVVRGMSNREIAESLFLSPKTVGRHLETIYTKIGVSTRVGATLFAVEHGLTSTRWHRQRDGEPEKFALAWPPPRVQRRSGSSTGFARALGSAGQARPRSENG